ncbi:MAG: response regulator transcription factor [Acidimicrobiia bacterium]|nr:response regulator transcription factor [Acidimicrobiia bacterium]
MAGELVLVVDDDPAIAAMASRALRLEGYETATAADGQSAIDAVRRALPDAIVLDLGLPDIDGLDVCTRLRSIGNDVPILMLTARTEVADRVVGLQSGADDYLGKPFAVEELLARIEALLRRRTDRAEGPYRFGDVTLDPVTRRASRGDVDLELTRREFELLEMFMRNPGQVLDRYQLLERVWGHELEVEPNTVDVYVGYLRRKLESGGAPRVLQTVRGFGFALREG